jgi:hypothetical protein
MNSEITIWPDVAASTQGKTSHKIATAIAACSAGGRGRVFTLAVVDPSFMSFPLQFTGSAPGPAMLRHSLPAVLPGQHRQGGRGVVDIDVELSMALTAERDENRRHDNVAANCSQRHPSSDG